MYFHIVRLLQFMFQVRDVRSVVGGGWLCAVGVMGVGMLATVVRCNLMSRVERLTG